MIGARSVTDDAILAMDLETATNWVYDRVYSNHQTDSSTQMAIVLLASRLYKRRQSPDGLAGWTADGIVARIVSSDPDIHGLLTLKRDMSQIGLG